MTAKGADPVGSPIAAGSATPGMSGRALGSRRLGAVELTDVEVVAEGLAFPEGPVAMTDGSVVVVEIAGGALTRIDPDGTRSTIAHTGGGPNGAAIGPDGALYVCNNGGLGALAPRRAAGIQRVDPVTGEVDVVYAACDGVPLGAPNDLVFEASGDFWFTDLALGAVFHAAADGSSIRRAASDLPEANGIGLSPDGSTVYVALTGRRQLVRRRIVGPGELESTPGYDIRALLARGGLDPSSLVAGLPGAQELDSLAVEADGRICVATLVVGAITVFSPDGSTEQITLPEALADPVVTNLCFGGDDRRTVWITASSTGRLLKVRWPRPGLRLAFD